MDKIQRVSRYVSWALVVFLSMSVLANSFAALWGIGDLEMSLKNVGSLEAYAAKIPSVDLRLFLMFSGEMVAQLPFWLGLGCLIQVFRRYARAEIFTLDNVRSYRTIGLLFFANALVAMPVSEALRVLGQTWDKGPGQRMLYVGFGTTNLENMVYGAIILIISWVMAEALRLQDDVSATI